MDGRGTRRRDRRGENKVENDVTFPSRGGGFPSFSVPVRGT